MPLPRYMAVSYTHLRAHETKGHLIYSDGQVDDTYRGEELRFDY